MKNYRSGARFEDTNWEFIDSLKDVPFNELNKESYDRFVKIYKDPLYSFLRFSGYSSQDSEDLVQDLFVKLLETNLLNEVSEDCGKLRTYLIGALKRVIYRQHRYKNANKRGGGAEHQSVDESLNLTDASNTPDEVYDQAWAKTLILNVKTKLFEDQPQLSPEEKEVLAELLNWNAPGVNYKDTADLLGISVGALKSKEFRMRVQFKELLYQEIASTLVEPSLENIEAELEALRNSWEGN